MRERTPESSARSGNGASARDKPGVRQQRAPSRWRKSLLAVLAALVTASVQRLSFRSPQTCCAGDAEVVEQPLPADLGDVPGCSPPSIDASNLGSFGCELWTGMCMDQGTFISWDPTRAPGYRNISKHEFRLGTGARTVLPGHDPKLQGVVTPFEQPRIRVGGQLAGVEQPDVEARRFSSCTLPLVWWPPGAWDLTDVFLGSLAALHTAAAGPAPFIKDRRLKMVPATGGFRLPGFYHWLLLPFSKRQVEELQDFSSRSRRADPRRPRCFRSVLLCDPSPMMNVTDQLRPFAAAQWVMDFYKATFPLAFKAVPSDVLRIVVAAQNIANLEAVLVACEAWKPDIGLGYIRTECNTAAFEGNGFVSDLALLASSHLLVGTSAAPLVYGFFMARGSTVLELRPDIHAGGSRLQDVFGLEGRVSLSVVTMPEALWEPSPYEEAARESGLAGTWPEDGTLTAVWSRIQEAASLVLSAARN